MISVIDNAKEIACVSGTIPHNMIFSNGNAHITIIERHCLNNDIQADINRIKDLNVTYVDANMCIYPTEISYGPFIFAYNTWFSNYANDCGLLPPNDYYFQKKFIRHLYRKYKEKYTADHYESLYLPGYMVSFAENIWEAYSESEEFFKNYIFGIEPYKLSQCFTPRMMKRIVRIIIYKLLKKE